MYDHMLYVQMLMRAACDAYNGGYFEHWEKHCKDAGYWLACYQALQKGLAENKIIKIGDDYFYTD